MGLLIDKAKERTSELQDTATETSNNKKAMRKEKTEEKNNKQTQNRLSKNGGIATKGVTCM